LGCRDGARPVRLARENFLGPMRTHTPLPDDARPGFWRLPPGMLTEPGDRWLDARGAEHPLPQQDVGQPVKQRQVVLRAERRRDSR
jgi:hypothetical protein